MQVIRPEMARGLSPREQPVAIPYTPGARGTALHQLTLSHLPWEAGGCSMQTVCLWSSGYLFQTPRSKWPRQILIICSLLFGLQLNKLDMLIQISICWVVASYKLTTIPLFRQPCCLLINLYLGALTHEGDGLQCMRCSNVQKLMDWFLLFTVGPLLLSVKGIIDLAQMPPTILLPHPGGTGTPLERIAYLPGAQPPFNPRAFNPTSMSPGEDPPPPNPYTPCSLIFAAMISMFPHTSVSV